MLRWSEAAAKGDAFISWLESQDKFTLKEFLEERKEYRERAEEQADAAKLDPEAAAKAKEEKTLRPRSSRCSTRSWR